VCQYSSFRVCQYSSFRVCQYSSFRVCQYSSFRVCQYSSFRVCQYSSFHTYVGCHVTKSKVQAGAVTAVMVTWTLPRALTKSKMLKRNEVFERSRF
jgi:hypothetical protein